MRLSVTAAFLLSMATCSTSKSTTRRRHVKSLPNALVHETENIKRRKITNIFEGTTGSKTEKKPTKAEKRSSFKPPTASPTSKTPTASPTSKASSAFLTSRPTVTRSPRAKPKSSKIAKGQRQPFKAPTVSPTSTTAASGGKIFMTIYAEFRMVNVTVRSDVKKGRQLTLLEEDIKPIMESTIQYIVKSSLTSNQSVIAVNITNITEGIPGGIPQGTTIGSQIMLEEDCHRCEIQLETTTMNSTVMLFMNQSIDDGNFTKIFRMNAADALCANTTCQDAKYGSVVGGTFNETGRGEAVNPSSSPITTNPTTLRPTSSKPITNNASVAPTSSPNAVPTKAPSIYPTTLRPTSSSPTTFIPSPKPTTSKPTVLPSQQPTTLEPTSYPSFQPTSSKPTTQRPTSSEPTTISPSLQPTTSKPNFIPSHLPTTSEPTSFPSFQPTTSTPTTQRPNPFEPTTAGPSSQPTTSRPSPQPTTSEPTSFPSSQPTSSTPTTPRPTSYEPTTAGPSSKPTTSEHTFIPSPQPTTSEPISFPSFQPTTSIPTTPRPTSYEPTTAGPSSQPTTSRPSPHPTTSEPTSFPSSQPTSSTPTTQRPTFSEPTTIDPSSMPATTKPVSTPSTQPTTSEPISFPSSQPTSSTPSPQRPTSSEPTSAGPSSQPTTSEPTFIPSPQPTTSEPTSFPSSQPTTSTPTTPRPTSSEPTTAGPSSQPTTSRPSPQPTTSEPTSFPSSQPTSSTPTTHRPTSSEPTSAGPSSQPTTSEHTFIPSSQPTTSEPTSFPSPQPTTSIPTTPRPTSYEPTTAGPSSQPTTSRPSPQPTTSEPTSFPSFRPTTSTPTTLPTSSDSICIGGLISSPITSCPDGFDCLQNCDFGINGSSSRYNIDLSLELNSTVDSKSAYTKARAKWMEVITGDLAPVNRSQVSINGRGNCTNALPTLIDDMHICGQDLAIDGVGKVLGSAGPLVIRNNRTTGKYTTVTGRMRFDSADVENMVQNGRIEGVILHEMGHVVGMGTLWGKNGTGYNNLLDEEYNYREDTRATNVWKNDWGCVGTPPIEKDGGSGTAFGHWDETCLGTELMTGTANRIMPFSRLTIASVEDLGYTVNYTAADDFDGSKTPCCKSTGTSFLSTHDLSDDGRNAAIVYGRNVLSESQLSDDLEALLEVDDTGLTYVGDLMVVVLYEEEGRIFEVIIGKNDA